MRFFKNPKEEEFADLVVSNKGGSFADDPNIDLKKEREEKKKNEFVPLMPISRDIETHGEEIKIKVNRNGDVIESIDVECECGKKTQILFDYLKNDQDK